MTWAIYASEAMLVMGILLGLYRMIIGPNTLNRILAFDYISACAIGLTAIYSLHQQTLNYLEMILLFSLLGFATVISFMEAYFHQLQENSHE